MHNWPIATYLRQMGGLEVAAFGYNSLVGSIGEHARDFAKFTDQVMEEEGIGWEETGVVTHSMGGVILARALEAHGERMRPAKIALLAPPLSGSKWASYVSSLPGAGPQVVRGPGAELAAMAESGTHVVFPKMEEEDLMVVTGGASWTNPILTSLEGQDHDGTILNAESLPRDLQGKEVPHTRIHVPTAGHSVLQFRPRVMESVSAFLTQRCPGV